MMRKLFHIAVMGCAVGVLCGMPVAAFGAVGFSESAASFVSRIDLGINIGNTFDTPSGNEIEWGAQRVTRSLIRLYKTKGINAVRLPVTWTKHFDVDDPAHRIRPAFLDRVQDVIDICLDENMIVLVNMHHDGGSEGWPKEWLTIDGQNEDKANQVLADLWRQIAVRFKDYDARLVFESFNEIRKAKSHPGEDGQQAGKDDWSGKPLYCRTVNRYAKTFYDTVRATGGNNAKRYLLIPTYAATDWEPTCREWIHPNPKDDHVMVSIHAYEPGWFCLWSERTHYDRTDFQQRFDEIFPMLKKVFADAGVPIVIGEVMACERFIDGDKARPNIADRVNWAKHYGFEAGRYGFPCFLWDPSGEHYMGLVDRSEITWTHPEIIDGFRRGLKAGRKAGRIQVASANR